MLVPSAERVSAEADGAAGSRLKQSRPRRDRFAPRRGPPPEVDRVPGQIATSVRPDLPHRSQPAEMKNFDDQDWVETVAVSTMKVLYRVATTRRKNRVALIGAAVGWKELLNALGIHYGDRLSPVNS